MNQILRRPRVTERSARMQQDNTYVIEVAPSATKGDIRRLIEQRYKVTVLDVRTSKIHGKFRRKASPMGGYQPDSKKAIVRIKKDQRINWEEVA